MVRPSRIGPRELVYANPFQRIYRVGAEFEGFAKEYYVNDYGRRAALVVVREGRLLLVRQYRLFIDRHSWEVPGGRVAEGETEEEAAVRECLEETGVRCEELRPLLRFHLGLDSLHNPTHLFYAERFRQVEEVSRPGEVEWHEWVPLERCVAMISAGEIVDSLSIVAILSYRALVAGR